MQQIREVVQAQIEKLQQMLRMVDEMEGQRVGQPMPPAGPPPKKRGPKKGFWTPERRAAMSKKMRDLALAKARKPRKRAARKAAPPNPQAGAEQRGAD